MLLGSAGEATAALLPSAAPSSTLSARYSLKIEARRVSAGKARSTKSAAGGNVRSAIDLARASGSVEIVSGFGPR